MATIKDIANRLGVSVSTVSKGLNGASDISDELRQMVLDTAVEMGYATKRSKKVENRKLAIFIENMDYEAATQFGYEIVLIQTECVPPQLGCDSHSGHTGIPARRKI